MVHTKIQVFVLQFSGLFALVETKTNKGSTAHC